MRNYKKKTNRGETPKDVILAAVKEVAENQRSIRPVAEEYGINFMTLQRYVKKYEKAGPNGRRIAYSKNMLYVK